MLEHFKQIIVTRFPELAGASFTLLTEGWDSVGVDVDNRFIFKFPREQDGADALRREASMLALVRPRVTLSVPDLTFFDGPHPFSTHTKLVGDHLVTAHYEALRQTAKQQLAGDIARFYAELHAIEPAIIQAAGALPTDTWPEPDYILASIQLQLSSVLLERAEKTLGRWTQLGNDPYGSVYGFFDGHGWNMAFDHQNQRLNGIYDFGDAGFGNLHEEFIYTSFISEDLTLRVIDQYSQLTGRKIDVERVSVLNGVLLLTELADIEDNSEQAAGIRQNAVNWLTKQ